MTPIQLPQALPECEACGAPTRRTVHDANRGLCSDCLATYLGNVVRLSSAPRTGRKGTRGKSTRRSGR